MSHSSHGAAGEGLPHIDVSERGAPKDGQPQVIDRRLFMQLLVFSCPDARDPAATAASLGRAMEQGGVPAVIYEDANDPQGIGLLTWSEDPAMFVTAVRPALNSIEPRVLRLRPELTMLGRTYSSGFEPDLQ